MNPSQRPLPSTAGLMTDSSDHHGNRGCMPIGSASSSLNRAQYLQPNNAAYWLLEAYGALTSFFHSLLNLALMSYSIGYQKTGSPLFCPV